MKHSNDNVAENGPNDLFPYLQTAETDQIFYKGQDIIKTGHTNSFYIVDLQSIRDRVALWYQHLPKIKIHYAVKTNCDDMIIREMVKLGQNFDCASIGEINKVLRMGAKPEHIIFAHPCKSKQQILGAKKLGVKLMTFDSVEEAVSIHSVFPEA
jgi:ornithine decarboxylase